ncbi:MAG: Alanine racemase [Planctomycetota bacterium]|jgi:alanine racemase
MQDTSAIDIDLSAIDHNMRVVRAAVGEGVALCPIVKADAYGLGVGRVARRLVSGGAGMLAVYSLRQAIETAAAVNAQVPVLVLMPVDSLPREDELVRLMHRQHLHLVVHDEANLAAIEASARSLGVALPVHVEIDVGMSRGGARPEEASRVLRAIASSGALRLAGVFTHFSHSLCDAERTARQLETYARVVEANRRFIPADAYEHVASTYSLARGAEFHRSMVRFGLAWLGYGLEELDATRPVLARGDLRPVVRWTSRVVQAKEVPTGAGVGYGARWRAPRPSTIALVPVGYSDGYPVPREPAAVGGQRVRLVSPSGALVDAPVVGAVNMDQLTVDVTGLADGDPHAWIGCEVELVSRDPDAPCHLPRLAAQSGLIVHELLTRLNPRIPRVVRAQEDSSPATAAMVAVSTADPAERPRTGAVAG